MLSSFMSYLDNTQYAAEGVGSIFVISDSDGVDAHLDDWIIIATRLGHVAEI